MSTRIDLEMDIILQPQDLTIIHNQFNNPNNTPLSNVFISNLEMLKNGANLVKFNMDIWQFNPEAFCHKYYNDVNLALPLMLTNGIKSRFEFLPKNFKNGNILAPFIDDVYRILSFK